VDSKGRVRPGAGERVALGDDERVFVVYDGRSGKANSCSSNVLTTNGRSWFAAGRVERPFDERSF